MILQTSASFSRLFQSALLREERRCLKVRAIGGTGFNPRSCVRSDAIIAIAEFLARVSIRAPA